MPKKTLPSWLGKSLLIAVAVLVAVVAIVTIENTASLSTSVVNPFPDVSENSEQFTAIKYLSGENLLTGNEDGSFNPEGTLNRAEWAAILTRLAGADPSGEEYNNCFPDVKEDWFAPYVCLSKDQGWVKGYGSGLYEPGSPVQDIEVLVTLAKLTGWDIEATDNWYEPALNYAIAHNIYDENAPVLNINRENTAGVIFRTIATVSLGNDNYSEDLDDDVETKELYDIVDIDLENYSGDYVASALPVSDFSVTSDDGQVELMFNEEDLPKGVSKSDISVEKLDLGDASEGIGAVYSFEPDGLVFENPVTIQVTYDYEPDSMPILLHVSDENIEPVDEPEISINLEEETQIVTASVDSFSKYMVADKIFTASSDEPGVRHVGETFWAPITISYPDDQDITFVSETLKDISWTIRLERVLVAGDWKASEVYADRTVWESPPWTEISGGFFEHDQEFKCVAPGEGMITPEIYIKYYYRVLDENGEPGPLVEKRALVKFSLLGRCVMPSAKSLEVETECGGSVTISGKLDKYKAETADVKVSIGGSTEDANYDSSSGEFTYTKELPPGQYEYSVSALMEGADEAYPVSEEYEFEILPCPGDVTDDDDTDVTDDDDTDVTDDDDTDITDDDDTDVTDDDDDDDDDTDVTDVTSSCAEGLTLCLGECVDLDTDNVNCGSCATLCIVDFGYSCQSGVCEYECEDYEIVCSGECVYPEFNNDHCGSCDNVCNVDVGESCENGVCELLCANYEIECSGECVYPEYNNDHCGGCDIACDTDSGYSCEEGSCVFECSDGLTLCGGECVNLQADNNNCSACGVVCWPDTSCSDGGCYADEEYDYGTGYYNW